MIVCAFSVREARALIRLRNDWQTISDRTLDLIDNIIAEVNDLEGRNVQALHLVDPPILFSETLPHAWLGELFKHLVHASTLKPGRYHFGEER